MEADEEGFFYPKINDELCILCGGCKSVCPIFNKIINNQDFEQKIFAVKHRSEEVRALSTSGGMFTALSDYILDNEGIVYGAVLDQGFRVVHIRATTKESRNRMRGSKYVQSNMDKIYSLIQSDLKAGKRVLFTGTPCQAAGLKGYLNDVNTHNLILCDFICHGVPSHLLWQQYINFVNKKRKAKLKSHYFRIKNQGWHNMCSKNVFYNGKEDYKSMLSQLHMNLFLSDYLLRPCCYNCKFSSYHRCTDITIADFWGIERTEPDFDDNKGVSLVLINSLKGSDLFEKVRGVLEIRQSKASDCLQGNLQVPAPIPKDRDTFWKDFHTKGYGFIVKKYCRYNLFTRFKQYSVHKIKGIKSTVNDKKDLMH